MGNRDGIILGLIIGAVVAIALLNRNMAQLQTTVPITQSIQKSDLNWTPTDIPKVDDLLLKLQSQTYDSRLNQIESQLEKTTLHLEDAASKLLDLNNAISKIQTTDIKQHPIQPVFIQQQPPNVIVTPIENKSIQTQQIQPTTIPIQTQQTQPTTIAQTIQPTVQSVSSTNKDINQSVKTQDTIYKNNEKWDIKRGPDGRIKSLNIIRDIKKWEK